MEKTSLLVVDQEKQKTGLSIGKGKGHKTTKLWKQKIKKKKTDKMNLVSGVIKEIVGFSPYEKKIQELLKNEKDKKARRFAKKKLGSYKRSKSKIEEMSQIIKNSNRVNEN